MLNAGQHSRFSKPVRPKQQINEQLELISSFERPLVARSKNRGIVAKRDRESKASSWNEDSRRIVNDYARKPVATQAQGYKKPVNLPVIPDSISVNNSSRESSYSLDDLDNANDEGIESMEEESNSHVASLWAQSHTLDHFSHNSLTELKKALKLPLRIKTETMVAYSVSVLPGRDGFLFPRFLPGRKALSGAKTVRIIPGTTRIIEEQFPRNRFGGLFGFNLIMPAHREICLTTTEVDSMAIFQETRMPALAVDERKLSRELLDMLEDFDKIHIWFSPNLWEKAKFYASRLLYNRCHVVKPQNNPGAPGHLLHDGDVVRLTNTLRSPEVKAVNSNGLLNFRAMRADLLHQLQHKELHLGIKWLRYKKLSSILKGFRMGELTILTGPTGSGKTTFLAEYSLDLCEQGMSTLWCNFETSSQRLAKIMLKQFARMDLENHIEKFDYWADRFSQLPLLFANFHGTSDMRKVTDAIERSITTNDVQHVVLDNLQFMPNSHLESADKSRGQEEIVSRFRRMANDKNVHVTLVLSSRNRQDIPSEEITIASLYGSEKASQEADNILVLQQLFMKEYPFLKKYLQVLKNRYDGELELSDKCSLQFDRKTNCFTLGKGLKSNNNSNGS